MTGSGTCVSGATASNGSCSAGLKPGPRQIGKTICAKWRRNRAAWSETETGADMTDGGAVDGGRNASAARAAPSGKDKACGPPPSNMGEHEC
ncbi:hypothetical protein BMMON4_08320 [Burkholderia mallei]